MPVSQRPDFSSFFEHKDDAYFLLEILLLLKSQQDMKHTIF